MAPSSIPSRRALIVIDIQNDYFPGGAFEQWHAEQVLNQTLLAMAQAQAAGDAIILVQHIADTRSGPAPFFNPQTQGVALHPQLLAAAVNAPIVVKQHADSFLDTTLTSHLQTLGCDQLLICGMMTQNCITHTALSPQAANYQVAVLSDACSSVSQMIHLIALRALADRIPLLTTQEAWPVA